MAAFDVVLDGNLGLGCKVGGGLDSPVAGKNDNGIYITEVMAGGAAQKAGLQIGDQIRAANGIELLEVKAKRKKDVNPNLL